MNVADVMTSPVITVAPTTAIAEAARLMLEHRVSGLPVVDPDGAVLGIVTEGDLLRRAETGTEHRRPRWLEFLTTAGRLAEDYTRAHARKVSEVMSANVISVAPKEPLTEIVRLMEQHRVKRLPVIDAGRLVGIVSRANLVRALVQSFAKPAGTEGTFDDTAVREHILAEIARQPWGPRASVDVRVEGGVVELHGSINDERERTALQVLAENTPGVREVRDALVWIEPMVGIAIPIAEAGAPPRGI